MKIFIGHGHSPEWLKLRHFLTETLALPCDDFDAAPAAGKTIVERLQEMLKSACFAFLVLTGEDERPDGSLHARANVIHEAGLFQERLGFKKAIVLLEDGCSDFSNIRGLVVIRFPQGDILARSEHIHGVLLREGILDKATQRGFAANVRSGARADKQPAEMRYLEEVYWLVREGRIVDGPFCPHCHDKDGKHAHMQEDFIEGVDDMSDYKYGGHVWRCVVCLGVFDRNPASKLKGGVTIAT